MQFYARLVNRRLAARSAAIGGEGETHAIACLGEGRPAHHGHGRDHAGDPQTGERFCRAWRYAKYLYLSPELARALFRTTGIISPIQSNWTDPVYDQPSPYFSGQRHGQLYIAAAPAVPPRTSSPYNALARFKMGDGALALKTYAQTYGKYTVEELLPEARRQLAKAEALVHEQMQRNLFFAKESE